ncbi:Hpt domain-containing protein [Sphingosinicella soli]|uniref:HPt (Histidine-containing phosphotransfer) domain-containing protein n=1 Tax=Sphingosinicella soli TaxID=333708 RepID=A0A7W7B0N8_9SPHN|nr:Hpt domain-containing protein [Sphingosinicella soli]MBB4631887.1 HPt (histidine-containing phosphotransfer) domain-containing protein [Sphingosinicella soli]
MIDEDFESLHQDLSDKLEDIQLLLLAGSYGEVQRQLHSLKGIAKAFGFNDFAAEVHAAEETPANVATLQPHLDRMFRLLDAA